MRKLVTKTSVLVFDTLLRGLTGTLTLIAHSLQLPAYLLLLDPQLLYVFLFNDIIPSLVFFLHSSDPMLHISHIFVELYLRS